MNTYYCTNYAPDISGVYESGYFKADSEDQAILKFKDWFSANYGHLFDDIKDFKYEAVPA